MATLNPVITAAVEQARTRRAQIDPAKVFSTLLMFIPWLLGWTARKVVIAVWWLLSYLWACVEVGWKAASPPDRNGGG